MCERNEYSQAPNLVHTSFTIQLHFVTREETLQGKPFEKKNFLRFPQMESLPFVHIAWKKQPTKAAPLEASRDAAFRYVCYSVRLFRLGDDLLFDLDGSWLLGGFWSACSFRKLLIL